MIFQIATVPAPTPSGWRGQMRYRAVYFDFEKNRKVDLCRCAVGHHAPHAAMLCQTVRRHLTVLDKAFRGDADQWIKDRVRHGLFKPEPIVSAQETPVAVEPAKRRRALVLE